MYSYITAVIFGRKLTDGSGIPHMYIWQQRANAVEKIRMTRYTTDKAMRDMRVMRTERGQVRTGTSRSGHIFYEVCM